MTNEKVMCEVLDFNTLILQMSSRRGSTEVHEFDGTFLGYRVQYKVTSVIGHVFRFPFLQTIILNC